MINRSIAQLNTITLPKREYSRLKQQAKAYRDIIARMFEMPLRDTINEVVSDFRSSNLYTDEFLIDLEDGLRKSSYAK